MTDELTDKQRAERLRQAAALLTAAGYGGQASCWEDRADKIDPPPDPYAGLDDDQWVEVQAKHGKVRAIDTAGYLRRYQGTYPTFVRVVPDGDARDVLVIPVEDAREALDGHQMWCPIGRLVGDALAEHDERWSS